MQVTGHAIPSTEEVYDRAQPSLKGSAYHVAYAVAHDVATHSDACKQQLLPSAIPDWPSSLDLVISKLSRKEDEGDPLRDPGQMGTTTSPQVHAGQLVQEQKCSKEALSPRLRLQALLHLEALRVLEWCSLVLTSKNIKDYRMA